MDLDSVAAELYGLTPANFTAARNARASEAKRAGDRELARAIGKFRRPNVCAWLANVLVRERRDQVQTMLDLGGAIRQAQAQSAKDEIRNLQKERRHAVAALLDDAADLARDSGESMSSSVARDLQATLEAALLDPESAIALTAGRLTTGLRYAGLGWPGTTDEPSRSDISEPAGMVGRAENSELGLPAPDKAVLLAAAEAQRQAEAHLAEVEREADAGKVHLEAAARDRDVWRRKVADLEQQLGHAQEETQKAEHRLADAEQSLALAEQRLSTAQSNLAKAISGLDN